MTADASASKAAKKGRLQCCTPDGMLTLAGAIMRPAGEIAHGPYLGAEAYLRTACSTAIAVDLTCALLIGGFHAVGRWAVQFCRRSAFSRTESCCGVTKLS